jgi:subtilisin family serine protease
LALLFTLATLVGASGAHAAGGLGGGPASRAEHIASLKGLAERNGEVALIVRFDEIGPPMPTLPPQAQEARIAAIAAVRERLLADLNGWGPLENVKRFEYTPHVALTTNARVIGVLEHHPLALEVVEDELSAPTLAETIPLIHANTAAWASGYTGAGQLVAILDSGVAKTHPFLLNKVVSEACYSTTSTTYKSTSLCPGGQNSTASGSGVNCSGISGCDHGTHVAGIAAGKDAGTGYSGVAKDAQVVAIQVFSRFDNPTYCGSSTPCILSFNSDQMLALQRVYALRTSATPLAIASANMSLGGGKYTANCDTNSLKSYVDNLRSVGTAVAIATGNDGYTNAISAPACISTAISVGSTCDTSGSYCSGVNAVAGYSNIASFVSLLAPGSIVTSSVPGGGYASWHGTSMATPHVAGAWALKKQQAPTASVDSILADFRATGVTVNDTRTGGSVTGMKRIDFVAPATYTLTVTHNGNGTVTSAPVGIDCGVTCAAPFAAATAVTLTAAPVNGYQFAGWGGACSGTESCVVTMNANASVSATFSLLTNAAPLANPDSYTGTAGSTMTFTSTQGVLANDSDTDGPNPLTASLVAGPANASTFSLASDGGFTYTPVPGFSGVDSITYRAFDGALYSNTATVSLTVDPAPCALPAAPAGLTATALVRKKIQLAWTDASVDESGFRIERSTNGGGTWSTRATVGAGVTTYTDSGLSIGATYSYRVIATKACGDSAPSNVASATAKR